MNTNQTRVTDDDLQALSDLRDRIGDLYEILWDTTEEVTGERVRFEKGCYALKNDAAAAVLATTHVAVAEAIEAVRKRKLDSRPRVAFAVTQAEQLLSVPLEQKKDIAAAYLDFFKKGGLYASDEYHRPFDTIEKARDHLQQEVRVLRFRRKEAGREAEQDPDSYFTPSGLARYATGGAGALRKRLERWRKSHMDRAGSDWKEVQNWGETSRYLYRFGAVKDVLRPSD